MSSESVLETDSMPRSAMARLNSVVFTRLPLWAMAMGPNRVINTTGWALQT